MREYLPATLTLYELLYQFLLKDGVPQVLHYGLLLAKVAGLHVSVIDTKTSITSQITEQEMTRKDANCSEEFQSLRMVYHVAPRLLCLKALQKLKEGYAAGRLT
ncbi:hypothetical protein HU200_066412 [Digitaria exilis]|uniref:Uncharacterized protein n=1 Tax=Digitaria exilis TaxID=1010633 RepID=A0A835DX33_9POAL|nr:hypothetical protein HU200_066412 [Digitaria exilis]